MGPTRDKNFYRTYWKGRRAELTDLSQKHSAEICNHILHSPVFKKASRVGLFCGRPWEVDLKKIWEACPKNCFFPATDPQTQSMDYYSIESWEDLLPAYAKILEPPKNRAHQVQGWTSQDLILVPGTAFDKQGGRVGTGAGYYDRYLEGKSALFWGVCFSPQVEDSFLAQEPTDVRMRALCTEQGILTLGF